MTREEAIEKVKDMKDYIIREHSPNDVFVSHMNEAIETLERPHGEWKPFNSYYKNCSNCNRAVVFDFIDPEYGNWFSFCPNCGARMKEGGEK